MNNIDLKDRIAIVTGGAQGFGLAIVEKFLASHAKVIIWDKDVQLMNSLKLENITTIEVDVTNFDSVGEGTKQSIEKYGSIDILVK